jgi:hypothetical protein
MTRVEVAVLVPIALSVVLGCSTTSGSTWVSQPEPGPFAGDDIALAERGFDAFDEPSTTTSSRDLEVEGRPEARPRLDRTITLGEVHASYAERAAAPAPGPAPVNVTINNYVAAPNPNTYDGYYAPAYYGDFRRGDHQRPGKPSARPSHPGQNWPALPSYGPAFPFKTAPASPWAPAR